MVFLLYNGGPGWKGPGNMVSTLEMARAAVRGSDLNFMANHGVLCAQRAFSA